MDNPPQTGCSSGLNTQMSQCLKKLLGHGDIDDGVENGGCLYGTKKDLSNILGYEEWEQCARESGLDIDNFRDGFRRRRRRRQAEDEVFWYCWCEGDLCNEKIDMPAALKLNITIEG